MLSIGTGYYVLDINHTKPRLFHFTPHSEEEVTTETMPGLFEETIDRDEYQQHIQHQSAPKNMFHGQSESGALDADTLRYYKLIAKSTDDYLADHDEPLLITGTENRIGHIRALLGYHNVMKESIEGNKEDLNAQQLQDITITVIKSVDIVNRDELVAKAKNTPPSGLTIGCANIEAAIVKGQVETLFLSCFRRTADNVRNADKVTVVLQLSEEIVATESLVRGALSQGAVVVAVRLGSFDTDEPLALLRF